MFGASGNTYQVRIPTSRGSSIIGSVVIEVGVWRCVEVPAGETRVVKQGVGLDVRVARSNFAPINDG